MSEIKMTELQVLQMDDSRRAVLTAAAAIRCVAADAEDQTLLVEARNIHSQLANLSDALAELRMRARVVSQ